MHARCYFCFQVVEVDARRRFVQHDWVPHGGTDPSLCPFGGVLLADRYFRRRIRPYGETHRSSMRWERRGLLGYRYANGLGQRAAMEKEPKVRARRAGQREIDLGYAEAGEGRLFDSCNDLDCVECYGGPLSYDTRRDLRLIQIVSSAEFRLTRRAEIAASLISAFVGMR